jgi:hypothetical protein
MARSFTGTMHVHVMCRMEMFQDVSRTLVTVLRNRNEFHCESRRRKIMDMLNCFLIPWCRTSFEKLIFSQVVKKCPISFMKPEGSLPCSQKPATGR